MNRPSKAAIAVILLAAPMSLAQDKQASPPVNPTTVIQESVEPPDHGAYYKAKEGWQKLELLTATGMKVGAFSGGRDSFRGVEAPVQLSDRRPVFYLKTTPDKESWMANAARNIVIVLLDKKSDHRELQMEKG